MYLFKGTINRTVFFISFVLVQLCLPLLFQGMIKRVSTDYEVFLNPVYQITGSMSIGDTFNADTGPIIVNNPSGFTGFGRYLVLIVYLLVLSPFVTKRLHDMGYSGWCQIVFWLCCIVPVLAYRPILQTPDYFKLYFPGVMILYYILLSKSGKKHNNRYGVNLFLNTQSETKSNV